MHRRLLRGATVTALLASVACARSLPAARPSGPPSDAAALRIGTTLDYGPFSEGSPSQATGFDLTLARRFAVEIGRPLAVVPVTWPELTPALLAERYDAAIGGVTVRPDRSLVGRFSTPLAETGAVVLVPAASPLRNEADLTRPGLRLAVNAGGHLERVARARFPRAIVTAVPDNAAVPERLARGEADAVMTDSAEAPRWQRALAPTRVIGPLSRDRKAWLLAPDEAELALRVDDWLAAREADGTLARARAEWLGAAGAPTATPLPALLAAIDERLSLMPYVADAKARAGLPVTDAAQEARVVAAGRRGVAEAATARGRPAPPDAEVDALFRALIDAASEIQRARIAALAGAPPPAGPDLDAIRPAIARVSERVARALVTLEGPLDAARVQDAVGREIRSAVLSEDALRRIADAIAACATPADRRSAHGAPAARSVPNDATGDPRVFRYRASPSTRSAVPAAIR